MSGSVTEIASLAKECGRGGDGIRGMGRVLP